MIKSPRSGKDERLQDEKSYNAGNKEAYDKSSLNDGLETTTEPLFGFGAFDPVSSPKDCLDGMKNTQTFQQIKYYLLRFRLSFRCWCRQITINHCNTKILNVYYSRIY